MIYWTKTHSWRIETATESCDIKSELIDGVKVYGNRRKGRPELGPEAKIPQNLFVKTGREILYVTVEII